MKNVKVTELSTLVGIEQRFYFPLNCCAERERGMQQPPKKKKKKEKEKKITSRKPIGSHCGSWRGTKEVSFRSKVEL
jgi:hypothetical protein